MQKKRKFTRMGGASGMAEGAAAPCAYALPLGCSPSSHKKKKLYVPY